MGDRGYSGSGCDVSYEVDESLAFPPMPGSDTAGNDNYCLTEALFNGGDDGTHRAGPSSSQSSGSYGPTSLSDSVDASAVPDPVSGCRIIEKKEPRSRRTMLVDTLFL